MITANLTHDDDTTLEDDARSFEGRIRSLSETVLRLEAELSAMARNYHEASTKLDIASDELTLIYAGELHQRNQALEANNAALQQYAGACRDEAEAIRYRLRGVASWYRKTSPHCFATDDIPVTKQPELMTI